MTPTFDLRTQPWVLTRMLDGRMAELSLHDVFRRAHEARDLVGEVPTQTFALTRLLLAILHRALGEVDSPLDDWRSLWHAPTLPADEIEEYLDDFEDRFDLLHPATPFFQVADLHTQKNEMSGLEKLIVDVPNGHRYFTTRTQVGIERISFAEAARWLVHCQAFDTSGIKSGAVGDNRVKNGKGYPIGTAWAGNLGGIHLDGASLKDTLLLNLVLATRHDEYFSAPDDLPPWERPPLTAAVEDRHGAGPRGQIDLFTWQARRIRLGHDGTCVTSVLIANGDVMAPQNQHVHEPMSTWRRSATQEKKLGEALVYMPRTHDPERSMWHGLAALLPQTERSAGMKTSPAGVLDWIALLRNQPDTLHPDYVLRTHALGIKYGSQSSTVAEIVDDSLSIHAILVSEQGRELAAVAIDAVAATETAVTAFATLAGNLATAAGGDAAGERDRAREHAYFLLDAPYRQWLAALDASTDADAALANWFDTARSVVWTEAQDMLDSAGPAAWVGRPNSAGRHVNTPQADAWFRHALRQALPVPTHTANPAHSDEQ
ncbi:MAG TPA: type I-E CRISPR-associated protein Cse1/CasA [Aldersonia sp.]